MLKTLFATTALASMLALGANAQTAPAAEEENASPPMIENHMDGDTAPADDTGTAAPITPDTADSEMAPAEGTDPAMAQDPAAPAADEASPDVAQDPAVPATDAESDMAQEPAAPATDTDVDTDMAQDPMSPTLEEGWSQVDMATISADTLIGTDVRNYDQESIATVDDVLMTPEGQVENVAARFGGFLGFGENTVLLTMDEISVVQDADGNVVVLTNLTPDALKDRPDYEADTQG